MNEKAPSGCECDEGANEASGLKGESRSWPYPTRKTRLCAHQPVPWKGTNAERGADESSFLTDSDKL